MSKMTASAFRTTEPTRVSELSGAKGFFRVERHANGDVLYRTGEPADRAYIVRSGRVRLVRASEQTVYEDMHQPLLAILKVGDLFGEVLRPAGAEMEETAIAHGPVEVWSIDGRELATLVEARPPLALEIIKGLGERNRALRQRTAGLTFKEVPARLAEQILMLVESHGERCLHGGEADLRGVTQQDLADLVGASRSFVSTLINEMKRDGMLGSVGRTLCVRDARAIEQLASAERF